MTKNHVKRRHIVIHLPYLFSVRDFLYTSVWDEMVACEDVRFTLLCNDARSPEVVNSRNIPHISAMRMWGPRSAFSRAHAKPKWRWLAIALWVRFYLWLDDVYLDHTLTYRFAAINRLASHLVRKQRSAAEQLRQQVFHEYRRGETAGRPFPRNPVIYRWLYKLRHGCLNVGSWCYEPLIRSLEPDLFVFGRLHYVWTPYIARALKKAGVPMVGIVSSWDHLTTKCPTPPGMSQYLVASRRMEEELAELHGISKERIIRIGKVQMDVYKQPSATVSRATFCASLGIPESFKLITFGTNATGLKEHEVSIAKHLAEACVAGRYGRCCLLLRAHPQDEDWKRDFGVLSAPPGVVCIKASSFVQDEGAKDQAFIANLMCHSDVVIQSRGSLALDAIAFDKPVISLAFDGDLNRSPQDSFLREYEYEHYKPIVRANGTWMVGSYQALDEAIRTYLAEPKKHAEGRQRILFEQIEPLDGKAGNRLVETLVSWVKQACSEGLPSGDWCYRGLGDIAWSERQTCRVQDYVHA